MKKRLFHCARCDMPCQMYKQGKGHRVLICPNHGVIASNPLPLLAAALPMALKGIKAGAAMLGGKGKAEAPKETGGRVSGYTHKVNQPILVDID